MGLGSCYSFIKYLLIVFNFIFWVVGLAAVALSIWMLVDPTFYVSMVQKTNDYLISIYILLVAGILLVIVGFLGCCGAFKESTCLLITFFSLLLVVFVAEIAAGLWGYLNQETLSKHLKYSMEQTVEKEYEQNTNRKLLFDVFQSKLQCCGVEKPTDWSTSSNLEFRITTSDTQYKIPTSCCRENVSQEQCEAAQYAKAGSRVDEKVIYTDGCYQRVIQALNDRFVTIACVGGAIAIIQIFGLIFAVILAFAIKRSGRYKA